MFKTRSVCSGLAAIALSWLVWVPTAAAEWHSDAWVTTKAKMALLTADGVSGTAINVDTVDGRLTLHGKVSTDAEKQKAQEVVQKIDGVRDVRNLLAVVSDSAEKRVDASDEQIKERVEKALSDDKALADSSIDVQSVNAGVVLLAGKANSLDDHLRALECARSIPGVRRVATEVQSPDTIADAEIRKDRPAAGDAPGTTGSSMSDAWITTAVKMRLLANDETPALDINVDTRDAVVTLFGIVPTQAAKDSATAEARKVDGVKNVRNELQIVAKAKQEAVEVKDEDLTKRVTDAMDKREALDDSNINVEVKNGVVRLTGSVPSENHRLVAAITARAIDGVRSVHDELTISPKG